MGTVVEDEESRGGTGARDGAAADSSTRNVGKKNFPTTTIPRAVLCFLQFRLAMS
jgi:hypothetical protein